MRLLCDHNVASKYVQAFERTDAVIVSTVAVELSAEATDDEIVRFAERDDWIVFTSDDDFFDRAGACGLLVYNQLADPSPGNVTDAVMAIDSAYESNRDIVETVPGDWI